MNAYQRRQHWADSVKRERAKDARDQRMIHASGVMTAFEKATGHRIEWNPRTGLYLVGKRWSHEAEVKSITARYEAYDQWDYGPDEESSK